ncbi:MAG: preprotein translocase subunit SecG, partial [Proteobacteria bacterium]|nr:preprotein translocase subunit SecG [Pseudomonadota bacterium]
MHILVIILHVIVCIVLILTVLLQAGKGASM